MKAENSEFVKSSIGYLPRDWNIKSLNDVCIEKGLVRGPFGGSLKKEFFVAEGYKVYEQKNAIYQDAELGEYYIDENKFNELNRFEVNEGDFIVSCSGTIGKIFRIPKGARKGVINQALLNIKINHKMIISEFFYQYFQWRDFQKRIVDNTQGGAMPNLVGMDIFKRTQVPLPPINEQHKIASILSTWDKAIELKEKLIEQKKKQKKGLMQKLLTGKVGVSGVKEEWQQYKLNQILKIRHGKDQKKVQKENGCYPILGSGGQIGSTDEYLYNKESVLIGRKGTIDKPVYMDKPFWTVDTLFYTEINEGFYPKYIYYLFNMIPWKEYNEASGVPSLSAKTIGSINVSIPEFQVQKAISRILSTADDEIQLLETMLESLKQQKRGLMQVLLTGKVRVKV